MSHHRYSLGRVSTKRWKPRKPIPVVRRSPDMPGLRRAHLPLDHVTKLIENAPADVQPLIALAAVWLWNMAEDNAAAAHCVDGCLTLHYALAEYGLASELQAVGVGIAATDSDPQLHGDYEQGPHYNADGTFNGHTILVVPEAHRFLDPTVQQFPEVPRTAQARLPLLGRLPAGTSLGTVPFHVDRTDHFVMYVPYPDPQCYAWECPIIDRRAREYEAAGGNLAANVFDMLRCFPARLAESPYPRLRTLHEALAGAQSIADRHGRYRFADPATGRELRLADIS
jgi:hypothetical protein